MEVFGILGNRGSFKTCKMVSHLWHDVEVGRKICTNFHVNFPHQRRSFAEVRDELKVMEKTANTKKPYIPTFKNKIMAFDEIGTGADSYDFLMAGPKELSWFVSQLRKLHCLMYYTDQRYGKVVKRIRDLTNRFWLMRDLDENVMHYPDGTPAESHRDVCAGLAEFLIVDDDLIPIGNGKPERFDGKPWYDKYDTDEVIFNT